MSRVAPRPVWFPFEFGGANADAVVVAHGGRGVGSLPSAIAGEALFTHIGNVQPGSA